RRLERHATRRRVTREELVRAVTVERDRRPRAPHLAVERPGGRGRTEVDLLEVAEDALELGRRVPGLERRHVGLGPRVAEGDLGPRSLVVPGAGARGDVGTPPAPRAPLGAVSAPVERRERAEDRARVDPPAERRPERDVAPHADPAGVEEDLAEAL